LAERNYFGTDGVRGRFGEPPITPETILKLGWAAGRVLGGKGGRDAKVIIGKDTRVSGYLLESALEAGLAAAGVNIVLLGPMPTPGIAYLTRTTRARAGIVISASHNGYEDNGIKFFSPEGVKLPDEVELEIEAMMDAPLQPVSSGRLGKAERFPDAAGRYIEFCKSAFPNRLSLEGIKLVVDCANGAAYHIAPSVFEELGAEVIAIANQPDGFNINRHCGSTHPDALQRAVVNNKADLGVALDGDGDRVILVDHRGAIVDGDSILYILAMSRKLDGSLVGGVVGTIMANLGLEQACQSRDIRFIRSAVGDRYVLTALLEQGWQLGGETSGHIICLDKSTTGDGIIAALQVLQSMVQQGRALADLCGDMVRYPQTMINVRLPGERPSSNINLTACKTVQEAMRTAEHELSTEGRVVLRASGTEPVIRVMVEGRDSNQVDRISRALAKAVEEAAVRNELQVA